MKPYYDEDGITIYCGDCREILPHIPKVDLVLTDPPYGINYSHGAEPNNPNESKFANVPVVGDDKPFDPSMFLEFDRVLMWGANHYCGQIPSYEGQWLVWDKRCQHATNDLSDCEFAWARGTGKKAARIFYHWWDGYKKASERGIPRVHPTQKPVQVMSWCLSLFPDAQTILDPFMGSGTTLVAAKQLGRKAIGIEIEPKYCDIAIQRLAQKVMDFGERVA